jgi:hypothetical protein
MDNMSVKHAVLVLLVIVAPALFVLWLNIFIQFLSWVSGKPMGFDLISIESAVLCFGVLLGMSEMVKGYWKEY